MKNRNLSKYGFGGTTGDPVKVRKVPDGYVEDTDFQDKINPSRKYFKKITASQSTPIAHNAPKVFKRNTGTMMRNPIQANSIDRVYTEPETEQVQSTPQKAFMGENIFMNVNGSNRAIGLAKFPIRNSVNASDGGMLDTGHQDVQFQYYNKNSSDTNGNTINIPSADWNNKGTATNFADSSFINKYIKTAPTVAKFAFGGTIDDLDEDELAQVQQYADENGVSVDEAFDTLGADDGSDDEQYAQDDETPTDDSEEGFAYGGSVKNKDINVEGGEVIENPNGRLGKVKGSKHENGGVNVNVPVGAKIFSDRLMIDGKTMAERKMSREAKLAKLNKAIEANPGNQLTKNTVDRTSEIINSEDEKDMMIQKMANHVYQQPKARKKFGFGGTTGDPTLQFLGRRNPYTWGGGNNGYEPSFNDVTGTTPALNYSRGVGGVENAAMDIPSSISGTSPTLTPNASAMKLPDGIGSEGLSVGSGIGIGANVLGAILPLINTRNAARATKPNINRYIGFGHDALDSNESAQDYIAGAKTNQDNNIETEANTGYARNANSATGVSTIRALNIATDLAKNKALNASNDTANRTMAGLLGQRGQLQNQRDQYVDYGQSKADDANKADTDNYFTNHGADLSNFVSNIEGLGKNLNVDKSNRDNEDLLALLSKNGIRIGRDKNGKRIIQNTK